MVFVKSITAALLLLSSAQLSAAVPFRPWPPAPSATLPSTGGPTPLPGTSLSLKYVAIGRGIQNYTCASVGAKPAAMGAIATLYDATSIADENESTLHSIPPAAVNDAPAAPGGVYTLPSPYNHLPLLGHHYFALDTTPTFALTSVGKLLYGSKNGDIAAPSGASAGPANTGAVDWLSLVAKPNYDASVGLGQVYRVETAGGNAPASCPSTDVISVQYAAEYWFYD